MAPTVLVIDDHDKLRALLKSDLEEAGFRVALAPDGAAARAALQQERADAVVLDLHLPDVDGRELLSELRERYPSTPVVVLTAQEELEAVVECMRRGAVDYLNKPFERTRLLTTLRNACARSELQASVESLTAELRQRQGLGQGVRPSRPAWGVARAGAGLLGGAARPSGALTRYLRRQDSGRPRPTTGERSQATNSATGRLLGRKTSSSAWERRTPLRPSARS